MGNILVLNKSPDSNFKYSYGVWTPDVKETPEELGKILFGDDYVLKTCAPEDINGNILISEWDNYKLSAEYTEVNISQNTQVLEAASLYAGEI